MVLDADKIQRLLDAVKEVVECEGSWDEKINAIMERADVDEVTNLDEFVAQFADGV